MNISSITMQCIRSANLCTSLPGNLFVGVALCATMAAVSASESGNLTNAKVIYQSEREYCLNGHSNQDRATCLKEAGAAFEEAKHGRLSDSNIQYQKNATIRCEKLDFDARQACEQRMHGDGAAFGNVAADGLSKKQTVPIAAQ